MTEKEPIWKPASSDLASLNMTDFRETCSKIAGRPLGDFAALHRWSTDDAEAFWGAAWDWGQVVSSERGAEVLRNGSDMLGARFFPGARLNYAENLLRRNDDAPAIIAWSEKRERRVLGFSGLRREVSRVAQFLRAEGVVAGDRVVGWLPNVPEAFVAMLAAASIGAVWASCSPDFGIQGVLDRFGQIGPKIMFAVDGYSYGGRDHECLERLQEITKGLPELEKVVVVPLAGAAVPRGLSVETVTWADATACFDPIPINFAQLPYDHPVFILFTSGTTGKPKCLVHRAGGILLKHITEHGLHFDIKRDDRVYFYTTLGWAMWNWLASVLARGSAIVIYDGSPFHPTPAVQFDIVAAERVTMFGTSAKFIDSIRKSGLRPGETHDLTSIRVLGSTGSPLVAENYDYVYGCISSTACLSSFAGGTDILGSFIGGEPTSPIFAGEIQGPCLGMAVEVFDEAGRPALEVKGELVCTRPFPSMPAFFWDDSSGERYRAAYFKRFENVWCQGDFAEKTSTGGYIMYGRSDAVLNPGGVRIGTAEIYQQIEKIAEISDSCVVGQEWDGDTRVVLFVQLASGVPLDDALQERIKGEIRRNTTPRHVPAVIVAAPDLPRTMNGKVVELAVREAIHGRRLANVDSLINPGSLAFFADALSGPPHQ